MINIGAEGFRWFIGYVEDINDPELLGRVKVRVIDVYSDMESQVSTTQLPWASIMMPSTSASVNWIGTSPTGLEVGSTVIGFFLDGGECNYPVVMGTIYGKFSNGESEIPPEARTADRLNKSTVGPEPQTAFNPKYPNNKTIRTKAGHVVEIDDTPNNERLHVYHKSGTYIEINNEGRLVIKAVGESYEVVANNKIEYITGDYTVNVTGNIVINGKTINLNRGTNGAARIGDTADTGDVPGDGSNIIETGSGTVFIGD